VSEMIDLGHNVSFEFGSFFMLIFELGLNFVWLICSGC